MEKMAELLKTYGSEKFVEIIDELVGDMRLASFSLLLEKVFGKNNYKFFQGREKECEESSPHTPHSVKEYWHCTAGISQTEFCLGKEGNGVKIFLFKKQKGSIWDKKPDQALVAWEEDSP